MTSSGIEDANKILSTGITIFPPSRRTMILSFSCSTLYINFSVNGKVVKPSYDVKVGDIVEIKFGDKVSKFEIIKIPQVQGKDMGELIKIL